MKRTISIALAFVGLLVGAGFATGREVIQYFIGFGMPGLWGAVLAGVVFTIAGAVILGLGSYFLADDHTMVFKNVAHPLMSRALDIAVTITLFCIGLVMLAGAGSNLTQQFPAFPEWAGAGIMAILVMLTGLLDVDKVSNIISALTPLVIIAVIGVFIYTLVQMPGDASDLLTSTEAVAEDSDLPVQPWWLSALNYNGLALMLGVSMCLVIGGNHSDPRAAYRGGLVGGILYTIMLLMAAFVLLANFSTVGEVEVPMLELYDSISPVLSFIMVWIIFGMVYNTCIGMFYALGRRLTSNHKKLYVPVFLSVVAAGYAFSFIGFETLMTYVYPVLGYIGMVMVVALLVWWFKHHDTIKKEMDRRNRVHELTLKREHPEQEFTEEDAKELDEIAEEGEIDREILVSTVANEVYEELENDSDIDYTRPDDALPDPRDLDVAERERISNPDDGTNLNDVVNGDDADGDGKRD